LRSDDTVINVLRDLEDEDEIEESSEEPAPPIDRATLAAELVRVEGFVARARSLPNDAKARSFQEAIKVILDLGRDGRGSGKAVVFTESITTQEYLRRLLLAIGLGEEDITLFRGVNDHERASKRSRAGNRRKAPVSAGSQAESRGGRAACARARVSHAFEGPRMHRGGRKRVEPAILRDGYQLRFAVEPAAHRTAYRALPSVQPAAGCHRGQLSSLGTMRRIG
jgi:hypothetical protein